MAEEKKKGKAEAEVKEDSKSVSDTEAAATSDDSRSEPDKDEVIKSLQGQISKLQKDFNIISEEKSKSDELSERLAKALIPEESEEDEAEVKPEDILKRVEDLRTEINSKDAEIAKNQFIDRLEGVSEAKKVYLKEKITPSESLEDDINTELEKLDKVIEASKTVATDRRPTSVGTGGVDVSDAKSVLDHPEAFK